MAGKEPVVEANVNQRGSCSACSCDFYDGGAMSKECSNCGHPPDVHHTSSICIEMPVTHREPPAADPPLAVVEVEGSDSLSSSSYLPFPRRSDEELYDGLSMGSVNQQIYGQERHPPVTVHAPVMEDFKLLVPHKQTLAMQHCTFKSIDRHTGSEFVTVSLKFTRTWVHGPCPTIDFVFAISNNSLKQRWVAYRQVLSDQTIEEHFHGTTLACNIMANQRPCSYKNCGICGISRNGLDHCYIRKNNSFMRFGQGFYLAPNSSKCHNYTQGNNGYRAMLFCDVCPGKKYYVKENRQHLSGPPAGYDSVYGQIGVSLNYPEIIIYNADAVMPRYIIVYRKDGIHSIVARSYGFSGHILSKVELQVLNSLLSAYSNDKVKKVQISVQNKPNITLEEVEITLRQNGLISIGNSLKENINKGVENMKHYEAYEQALQNMLSLTLRYLKFLFLGPPRSGKTTVRQRLAQEIVNLKSLDEASKSTGVAETSDIFIKKLVSESAVITRFKWQSLKRSRKQEQKSPPEELGDRDYHHLAQLIYQLISKKHLADDKGEQYSHQVTPPSESSNVPYENAVDLDCTLVKNTTERDQDFTELLDPDNIEDSEIEEAFQMLTTILLSESPEEFHQLLNQLIMINMVDIGGQPAFLEMLPMLTTGPALYFIFFRLDQELRKQYPVRFHAANNETETLLESSYCNEDVIYQCLSSIACFGCYSSADRAESQVISRAILFGTYKDQIESAQISQLDKTLRDKFLDTKLHIEGLLLRTFKNNVFFSIDNMNGDESEMSAIRTDIEGIIDTFFPAIPIPASWLMFRIVLHLLHKPIVTLAQCEAVANRLSMPTPVKEALWFFHHKVGSLMHYHDIPSMKDIVICDVQVIFDSISELIIDTFKISNRTIPTTAVDDFCNKGHFSLTHIKDRTEQQRRDGLSLLQLVDLLKHHNVLAEIDQNSECTSQEPKFIIPAVLKCDSEEKLKPHQQLDARTLMISFKCGFVPFGIFCAEIAHLISHQASMRPKWRCCDNDVRKNKVKFNIRGGYCTMLISRPQYLEIQVSKQHQDSHCKLPISEVCFNVLQTIIETLETVISKMKYKPYAKIKTPLISCERPFDFAFTCCLEESHGDHLMKVIKEEDEWYAECSTTNDEVTLRKEQLAWFEVAPAKDLNERERGELHNPGVAYYLTDKDHSEIYYKLESYAAKWRDIGKSLGFSEQEMDTIQSNPFLMTQGAPKSYLRELLTQYLQWGPGDRRGSKGFPTRDSLRMALQQANLSQLASRLCV